MKFNIPEGAGQNNNYVSVKSVEELSSFDKRERWDFVVVDEVHKYLFDRNLYAALHEISKHATDILLLSATPVQQKREEYLDLLRLLLPEKYDNLIPRFRGTN